MKRLSGIDAGFLYMETPRLHMHTIKVAVMQPAPGCDYGPDFVKDAIASRLHLLPMLRRRVVFVPFHLHHPVWIEDPDFDLERHLRFGRLPPPGGRVEMDAAISAICNLPLERGRPLWELHVLHGLAGGGVAFVAKIHHAVADGVAVANMLANVVPPDSGASAAETGAPAWRAERMPSGRELVLRALPAHVPHVNRFPGLLRRTGRNLMAVARHRRSTQRRLPMPVLDAPRTPFNGAVSARREFASATLSFADVRALKSAFGVTVNDVVVALVAASLRSYLERRGALPAKPLLAEIPMATDVPGAPPRLGGNKVSNLFASLCTDETDPVRRLRRIHDGMVAAKEVNRILGPEMYQEWSEYAPPGPYSFAMRLYSRWRMAGRLPPPINAIVSSVPGPARPLEWPGGKLQSLYSVGPLIENVGLNVTVWSYTDQLNVGVLVCPDLADQPHEIGDGMRVALAELTSAAAAVR